MRWCPSCVLGCFGYRRPDEDGQGGRMLILNDSTLLPSHQIHQIISYPLDGLIFCWLWRILNATFTCSNSEPEPWMVTEMPGLNLQGDRRPQFGMWVLYWDSSHILIYSQLFQVEKFPQDMQKKTTLNTQV